MNYTHHAQFLLPGSFVAEPTSRRLEARDIGQAVKVAPERAFAFRLYDVPVLTSDVEMFATPKPTNWSGTYYIDGELFSAEQVAALGDGHDTLLWNMRVNNWDRVVQARGYFQPFNSGDSIVSSTGRVVAVAP